MSPSFAAKAAVVSMCLGAVNLAVVDFVLVPSYVRGLTREATANTSSAPAENKKNTEILRASDDESERSSAREVVRPRRWIVLFALNSAKLTAVARRTLRQVLASYQEDRAVVLLEGYTDALGDAAYNVVLSRDRASAVARWLISHGVPADRITLRSYGEARAQQRDHRERPNREDRRVEIILEDR